LQNKEHSAENLDFYFWYLEYRERFSQLPEFERAKSPIPRETPTRTSTTIAMDSAVSIGTEALTKNEEKQDYNEATTLGAEFQPYREEINAVLRTFFECSSFKELNLDGSVMKYVRYHGRRTTHPDIFSEAFKQVRWTMEHSSLRNFFHHALQNIRYSQVVFFYACAIFNLLHIPMVLFYTYSHNMMRWWRLPLLYFTFSFVISAFVARIGFCVIRGALGRRQIPLYELEEVKQARKSTEKKNDSTAQNVSDFTSIIDPNVKRYNRVCWTLLTAYLCTFFLLTWVFLFCRKRSFISYLCPLSLGYVFLSLRS
jgi:Regulator of G protein signaling domain